jgi:dolichol-phosphate mannosyltransferase
MLLIHSIDFLGEAVDSSISVPHNTFNLSATAQEERTMQLSLVIPFYNEVESLEQLHREICDVAQENNYDLEMIFVDDGSTDQGWSILEKLAAEDSRVRGIQFRRNFGKAAALHAGFNAAKGDIIITLDADLQDDPREIPDFLQRLESDGLDVISGWKQRRLDPWHKVFPSRVFNAMVSVMTGVKLHDHNCGMKCFRREVLDEVALYGERHRFIPVLAAARGFKVGEKVIAHRTRQFGHSKYGFSRFIKGFLDLLTVWFQTRYGQRPQHFLGTIGLILIAIGVISYCLEACKLFHVYNQFPQAFGQSQTAFHIISGFLMAIFSPYMLATVWIGLLFIALGFAAELFVSKTIQPDKCYAVKKETADGRRQTAET